LLLTAAEVSILLTGEDGSTTQSSSIGAVRWTLPSLDESAQSHSSVPSRSTNPNSLQHQTRQNDLKNLRSLQECVQFIQHWKEQVDQVCKEGTKKEAQSSHRHAEHSLEESRKLILQWADELHHVDTKERPWISESQEQEVKDKDANEEAHMRIMEWAKELQEATERFGVQSEELGKMLCLLGLKKNRLVRLMPLLEFITWSLLKEGSMIPRYIPNSWRWICSAADVILDPMTNNPWLLLSDDQRKVQESHVVTELPHSSQRFDDWPCVLGWEGYSGGRHYWEVDIANNGYWRVGLTAADSKRHGKIPMTPKRGYWVLWRSTHKFYACSKPETELPLSLVPRRVGVYLDYDEGQISFYNAETKTHIYTFTGTFKKKLYPLFAPMDGRTLMT
uniref:Si:dkey-219e21.2 n=1 Tax=Amphilophus citrinellus TaxID=61819 RepID=A0A3Q0SC22_AMPCI